MPADVENQHAGPWNQQHNTMAHTETSHGGCLAAGLILTLFVSGFLPFSAVVIGLVSLLGLATACRAYILHQYAQQLHLAPAGRSSIDTALRLLRSPQGVSLLFAGDRINVANLRLSLMDRDFTDEDYEALLELDSDVARPRLSEAMLSTLRTHVHSKGAAQGKAGCGAPVPCAPGQTSSLADKECSVCLEGIREGACIMTLPCCHSFHTDCIGPWLRQQGTCATCPLCKQIVFRT